MATNRGRGKPGSFRLPPPLEELGPSSPSQDGPLTQGMGMARPLQTHLEDDTLGTLDEQEWNGLGMENTQNWEGGTGRAWGPGSGWGASPPR